MTAAVSLTTPADRPSPVFRAVPAVVMVAVGVLLLVGEGAVRTVEAAVASAVLGIGGTSTASLGSSVFLVRHGSWIGYRVAAGCSAALLIAPFWFVGAGLVALRGVAARRVGVALLAVSVFVAAVNQLRLLAIGLSMRSWGFRTGYDRSHVLAGGVLSTIGVVVGLIGFLLLTLRTRASHAEHQTGKD